MSESIKTINTLDMDKVSAILLDVAGTTTAISFVKETLYPYIVKNAEEFLKNSWEIEDVKKAIAQFEEKELDASKAAEVVKNLTEKDDANVGLKTIQGLLLNKGYESGELKGHVFADVSKFFESWSATKKFAIFSSGSVESQQLLFKNSTEGDLSSHIKKYFDLSAGSKTDSETYKKIAKDLEVSPVDFLFLTDDVKEAEAAKSAELKVVLVEREGNAPITEESKATFTVVKSFADVAGETMKRKIVEDSVEEPPKKVAKIESDNDAKDTNKTDKIEETKPVEEKKETETTAEAMEVDEEPVVTEKVEEEKVVEEEKQTKPEAEEKVESKPESVEETSEAMEVDSKETAQKSEEPSNKAETETGTQTKNAVTNECETQTTISIAAVDELPVKEVQEKLMAKETTETKTADAEEKVIKEDKKSEEVVEKNGDIKEDKETKEIDKQECTENVNETDTEMKEEKPEEKTEVLEAEKEKVEVKENGKETKEEVKETKEEVKETKEEVKETKEEVKETKEEVKETKEEVKETKEEVKETKEEVKETKEEVKETKEEVKETKEEVKETKEEVKENGCEKKEEKIVESKDKETTDEKKECLESNGAHENGVTEKENKSQLANGKDSDVPNGEACEGTNGTSEQNEEEIKVKKIADTVESAPVSVEA